jgi:hypothetical protein
LVSLVCPEWVRVGRDARPVAAHRVEDGSDDDVGSGEPLTDEALGHGSEAFDEHRTTLAGPALGSFDPVQERVVAQVQVEVGGGR